MGTTRVSVVVVIGVSGSGKTTVGRLLAERLRWRFVDADDLHPSANVAKMRAGVALADADRAPWLDAVRACIAAHVSRGEALVVACSALRRAYRRRLVESESGEQHLLFVLLDVPRSELERRLAARTGHYFPRGLLESQLATFEPPGADEAAPVFAVDGRGSPAEIVDRIAVRVARATLGTS